MRVVQVTDSRFDAALTWAIEEFYDTRFSFFLERREQVEPVFFGKADADIFNDFRRVEVVMIADLFRFECVVPRQDPVRTPVHHVVGLHAVEVSVVVRTHVAPEGFQFLD